MKLLLDTHTFIWWDDAPERLSLAALNACEDASHSLHLSLASVWEMQIKEQLGKVVLPLPLAELLHKHEVENRLFIEPIIREDIFALSFLPLHHRDPFDRMLVAQASAEGMRLLTADGQLASYGAAVAFVGPA